MNSYASTEETTEIMNKLEKSLMKTTKSAMEHDLEQFNNNWQWLKYELVDLDNAINQEKNEANRLGRKSPRLNKLDKSLMDIHRFEVWSIDRLTNQPTVS